MGESRRIGGVRRGGRGERGHFEGSFAIKNAKHLQTIQMVHGRHLQADSRLDLLRKQQGTMGQVEGRVDVCACAQYC